MKTLLYGIVEKVRNFLRSDLVAGAHIGQHASVLTLTTLFALVPLVSGVLWFLSQVPSVQSQLIEQFDVLLSYLIPEQALSWRSRADEWVQDVSSLQGYSAILLFGSLIFLVNKVDKTLHWVFQIEQGRGRRRWLHYLWVMPALMMTLIVAMTLVLLLQIMLGTGLLALLPGVNLTSVPVMWLLLMAVYRLSSRGMITWRDNAAVSLGVTVLFLFLKFGFAWLYITLPNWSIVFGVFSAVPLFLLWTQMAWSIFLYGAVMLRWLTHR
ncbi:YihY/virulence factor BrkB family protein [Reinekea blandensis]|uniref:YihY/virulence factor BrkB family protein n=1 Tax=Reinekea blandensis TaxID=374838 RepID=UPI0002F63B9C|nr:YhjD/YihY/BrkB family envelope integrity protein [Reinekea blandensis]